MLLLEKHRKRRRRLNTRAGNEKYVIHRNIREASLYWRALWRQDCIQWRFAVRLDGGNNQEAIHHAQHRMCSQHVQYFCMFWIFPLVNIMSPTEFGHESPWIFVELHGKGVIREGRLPMTMVSFGKMQRPTLTLKGLIYIGFLQVFTDNSF